MPAVDPSYGFARRCLFHHVFSYLNFYDQHVFCLPETLEFTSGDVLWVMNRYLGTHDLEIHFLVWLLCR